MVKMKNPSQLCGCGHPKYVHSIGHKQCHATGRQPCSCKGFNAPQDLASKRKTNPKWAGLANPVQTNPKWDDNGIQFPRLIAELYACGVFGDKKTMAFLRDSMNLSDDDILEIVGRAENEFDRIKGNLRKGRHK